MIYLVIITLCVLLMFIFITEKSRMYLGEVIFTTSYVWLIMQLNIDVRDAFALKGSLIMFAAIVQLGCLTNDCAITSKIYNEFKKSNEIRKNKKQKPTDIDSFVEKCRGKK